MKKYISLLIIALSLSISCKDQEQNEEQVDVVEETQEEEITMASEAENIEIMPISHASFVMNWGGQIIYVDPVGDAAAYEGMPAPEVILVTDIHGDHMDMETLKRIKNDKNFLFAPKAVTKQLDEIQPVVTLNNGEMANRGNLKITAIPMYNLTEGRLKYHAKGRGNGYVLEKNGYRVYISGDTEDIPEMRALEDIDKAFLCMNLPYTMDINQAANAVLEFLPDEVIPYHYRGTDGFQDVEKFKQLINDTNKDVEVTLLDWYPEQS